MNELRAVRSTTPARPARRWLATLVGAGVLVATSGWAGDASAGSATTEPPTSADDAGGGQATPVAITITESSIDGLPADLTAGVVDVTVTDETEAAGGEVDFTRVAPGTDPETFVTGLVPLFEGGPFPDYFLNNAGAIGHSMVTLVEGEYIVWFDGASNLDRPSTAEDIVTATLTVGPGDNTAEIPDTDGTITAGDYLFAVDVSAGGSTVTFSNSSAEQFHHVIIVDFGTNDPAVVEERLPELLQGDENSPLPEGIDPSQMNFEFASSGVFGPGSSGTFDVTFAEGTTYAALCFISDLGGGAPHAIGHNMFKVFQVGGA